MENCTIFVGRLAWAIDEPRLAEEFAQFGSITSTKVIRDRMTGRSKGFGYVEYSKPEEAQAALAMSGKEIEGFNINVDMSQPRQTSYGGDRGAGNANGGSGREYNAPRERREYPKSEPSSTVFVGNLSFQATEQDIQEAFSGCGAINQIRLPKYHDTGKMKGYAYVEFDDIEAAKACVNMQSATIAGRSVRLDFSQPRVERSYDNGNGAEAVGQPAPEGF
jgi:nucleolin